jgi:hypothetical protein
MAMVSAGAGMGIFTIDVLSVRDWELSLLHKSQKSVLSAMEQGADHVVMDMNITFARFAKVPVGLMCSRVNPPKRN